MQSSGDQRANLLSLAKGIRGNGCHPGQETQGNGKREYPAEEAGCGSPSGQPNSQGGALKKVISPERNRQIVKQVIQVLDVFERRAYRVVGQLRATMGYQKRESSDGAVLTEHTREHQTS